MEISNVRVVLPAMVSYKDDSGNERGVFVYIDHSNREVILVDGDIPPDATELRKAIYDHVVAQKRTILAPPTPTEGFTKLNPETYMS